MKIYRANQLHNPNGKTGMGKTSFWASIKAGDFPKPNVILSERFRGWTSDVVENWIESKRNDASQKHLRGSVPRNYKAKEYSNEREKRDDDR